MTDIRYLSELKQGQSAVVTGLTLCGHMRRRLLDIGLVEGTTVECVGISPLGDPSAFLIRGAVIALRKEDAGEISVSINKQGNNTRLIALAGNPNVGKSTVFNQLTGLRQHTGNWSGKTVTAATGYCSYKGREYILADIPGCYSLMAHSADEEAARDFLCFEHPDAVVAVCDATCLERNLSLVLQILEITSKVIVCINLMDEAKKKHIHINLSLLSKRLGVPVIGTAARSKNGLEQIFEKLEGVLEETGSLAPCFPHPDYIQKKLEQLQEERAYVYIQKAEELCRETVLFRDKNYFSKDRKIDRLFTSKATGFPIMFLLLMGILWLTITGANYPSQFISGVLFKIEEYLLQFFAGTKIPVALYEMIILGSYRVLAWVVSVMLPPMAIFFPLFTLLEDFGYLPRVAFNLDRCFKKCCACGKQALTMCMGFGCNAVGITGCRIIDSPRERLIAIITNNFVPCNGRFPTLIAIISMFFLGSRIGFFPSLTSAALLTSVVLLGILLTLLVSKVLSQTILKGVPSSFTLELPPYRRPQFGKVIIRSIFNRTVFVLARAMAIAAPAGLFIWLLANITVGNQSILLHCSDVLDPFARVFGLDGVILLSFILGLPANEIVVPIMIMAYQAQGNLPQMENVAALKELLVNNGWTWITAVSTMLFTLMHWPCSTTCLTIKKETGSIKWVIVSIVVPTLMGLLLCFIFASIAKMIFGS